jgi:hypothetical protein
MCSALLRFALANRRQFYVVCFLAIMNLVSKVE